MAASYNTVLVERREEGIAWISPSRPNQLHVPSQKLGDAPEWAAIDDAFQMGVVTGRGRAFRDMCKPVFKGR